MIQLGVNIHLTARAGFKSAAEPDYVVTRYGDLADVPVERAGANSASGASANVGLIASALASGPSFTRPHHNYAYGTSRASARVRLAASRPERN